MNHLKPSQLLLACLLFMALLVAIVSLVLNIGDPTINTIERTHAIYVKSSYWVDESSSNSQQTVLDKPFKQSAINDVPWQFGEQTYWLKINVTNRTSQAEQLVAHFDNPMLDELEIWQLDTNGAVIKHQTLGDTLINLDIYQQAFPHFSFKLEEKGAVELLIRIKSNGITKTPIDLYQVDHFNQLTKFSHLIWGLFIGVTIMIALYNLILFISIRDKVYLAYIGYIIFTLTMMGSVLGFGYYIWPKALQHQLQLYVVTSNFGVAICALLFGALFLRYGYIKTRLNQLIKFTLSVLLIGAIASLFLPEYHAAPVFFVCMALLYITIILIVFNRLLTDFVWAKFYFFSWLPLIIAGAVQPLTLVGVLEHTFVTRHAFLIGVLIEVVLMAMALADKFSHQQQESYFKATHDSVSSLPNETLYKYKVTQLIEQERNFITCFIELKNFGQFIPYMPPRAKQVLVEQVSSALSTVLKKHAGIITIEEQNGHIIKMAYLRDGVFALLLNHSPNKSALEKLLQTLQLQIPSSLVIDGIVLNLSSNIATCSSTFSNGRSGLLLRKTWQTLYQAKQQGVALLNYKQDEHNDIGLQFNLASELHRAIESNQLQVRYVPVFSVRTKKFAALSTEFHWPHDEYGMITQQEVIKLAIDTGLNIQLSKWLFTQLFTLLSKLDEKKIHCPITMTVALNQLSQTGFIPWLSKAASQFDTESLTIYTELPDLNGHQEQKETLNKLKDLGFNFGLNNFYGDLDRLFEINEHDFQSVRIGHLFTKGNLENQQLTLLLSAMVDVAKGLKLNVTATEVNDVDVADIVTECQCCYMQGSHLSLPLTPHLVESFLLSQHTRIGKMNQL